MSAGGWFTTRVLNILKSGSWLRSLVFHKIQPVKLTLKLTLKVQRAAETVICQVCHVGSIGCPVCSSFFLGEWC